MGPLIRGVKVHGKSFTHEKLQEPVTKESRASSSDINKAVSARSCNIKEGDSAVNEK